MCNKATARYKATVGLAALLLIPSAHSQGTLSTPIWQHVGNAAVDLDLAGLATGRVNRIWYAADGSVLIQSLSGKVFVSRDFETWGTAPADIVVPPPPASPSMRLPEPGAQVRTPKYETNPAYGGGYAFGLNVYRSDNQGRSWSNLTGFGSSSILGGRIYDLAISPSNSDDVMVAGADGVFRTLDGGKSWNGLNDSLPNLLGTRIRSLPAGTQGLQLELYDSSIVDWVPGEKTAWQPGLNQQANDEERFRQALKATAVQIAGDSIYAGFADGTVSVSTDGGKTFPLTNHYTGRVNGFWVDPKDHQTALVVLDSDVRGTRNGGQFWDTLSLGLPQAPVHGVTADRAGNAVYVATDGGVFLSRIKLDSMSAASWTQLAGLPDGPDMDVRLDADNIQLWVDVEGNGVYETLAPHRIGDPKVVSSADLASRIAAPGTLFSVMGSKVRTASAGSLAAPVLNANDSESQIQIPFGVPGSTVALTIEDATGQHQFPFALSRAAPAISVDHDGAPMLLDADKGVLLDAMHPAHSRTHVQILAIGLGQVQPNLPAGQTAPSNNPPQVVAPVRAWLDRQPVDVTRKVLWPGLVGYYLIEVEIPAIVNAGPAELYIEAGNQQSNRVRVYIEP